MLRRVLWACTLLALVACDDDEKQTGDTAPDCYDDGCVTQALPLSAAADAPTVVDVALECQRTTIVLLTTVTDPQGSDDLIGIMQTVGVHRDKDCVDPVITLQDDLAGSGLEESFGDAVVATVDPDLYAQICACESWPVQVSFVDKGGNMTTGRVVARVTE